jgi:integrase
VPCIGSTKVRRVDAEVIESLYSELRRCNDHCVGKLYVDHRTGRAHECDGRCGPHKCSPLKESGILYIHQILSGAFRRAVRYKWISISPMDFAEAPAAPKPKARPPSVSETACILAEAWKDPDWGTLIWLTMMGGNRRGELCGIRWSRWTSTARLSIFSGPSDSTAVRPGRATPSPRVTAELLGGTRYEVKWDGYLH